MATFDKYTKTTSLESSDIALLLTGDGTRGITALNLAKTLSVQDPITNHITFDETTGDIKVTTY